MAAPSSTALLEIRDLTKVYRGGVRAILPELDGMVGDGLITLERVEVIAYRAKARDGG